MRTWICTALAIGLSTLATADDLLGFDPAGSAAQRALESDFDDGLSAADMDAWLRRLSARPHHVGSEAGREVVEFTAELLESWGYEVEIAEYDILLPTPVTRELELMAPTRFTASLREDSLTEDPSTSVRDGASRESRRVQPRRYGSCSREPGAA